MPMHKLRNWLINRAWRRAREYNDQNWCTNSPVLSQRFSHR